jgi:hypothetical protein
MFREPCGTPPCPKALVEVVRHCHALEVGEVAFHGTPAERRRHPALTRAYFVIAQG